MLKLLNDKRLLGTMIKEGCKIPDVSFKLIKKDQSGACSVPTTITSKELFSGKRAILIGVPGAFTPVCSSQHVPGFIEKVEKLKGKRIDLIACTAVNDAYVLGAWNDKLAGWDKITMLADGSGDFAKSIGADLDLKDKGMGVRSKRYAMLIDDGVVKYVGVDDKELQSSSVDAVLKKLETDL